MMRQGSPEVDCTRDALDYLHGVLTAPFPEPVRPEAILQQLARTFRTEGAGLAGPQDTLMVQHRAWVDESPFSPPPLPWQDNPGLLAVTNNVPEAVAGRRPDGGSYLAVVLPQPSGRWLLWIEARGERAWGLGEQASLLLIGQVLVPRLLAGRSGEMGRGDIDRVRLHQRLQDAGRIAGRLAHDFDNILTGVLGFGELTLQQVSQGSPARRFLVELLRAAERGSEVTQRLRQFSRSHDVQPRPSSLAAAMGEEEPRLRKMLPPEGMLQVKIPPDLPLVALETAPLRQVIRHVLDNALEAIAQRGVILVSASPRELAWRDCLEAFGNLRPGSHVQLTVADSGSGMTPEVWQRLLVEPFFTTKQGRPGLGLATVYRILHAHGGGFRFLPTEGAGTTVEIFLPLNAPT